MSYSIRLRKPHPDQQAVLREAEGVRFKVLDCGRRWGKNVLGENRIIEPALAGYPVGWFSPSNKMAAEDWRQFKDTLRPLIAAKSEQEHRLELVTGGVVELWSLEAGPDVARGRRYKRVWIDEAAMMQQLEQAWTLSIRPTLADFRGDAWFGSTPKGLNYFYSLYQLGQDAARPDWISWKRPTFANPYIDPAEIEELRATMTERAYTQEMLAEFLKDGGGVFRGVEEACVLEPSAPEPDHTYVFGVDWGKSHDFTVISVMDASTREEVWLDRFNQIDYEVQVGRLEALAERYRPLAILAEQNSIGGPLIEHLRRKNLPVIPWYASNASKHMVIEKLVLALERAQVKLQADPIAKGELLAYDVEKTPTGMLRYSAPSGFHDDTVIARALANLAADNGSRPRLKAQSYGFTKSKTASARNWDPFDGTEPEVVNGPEWRTKTIRQFADTD